MDDLSTEEKIKIAADKLFTQKGYAATRTRDIAEESGINIALLNYYFRSKEKLFHLIMEEKVKKVFGDLIPIINNTETTLHVKIKQITDFYIDGIAQNPNAPLFILSEIRSNPENFNKMLNPRDNVFDSYLTKQLHEIRPDINPLQFILSIMGMIIFPFIASPILEISGTMDEKKVKKFVQERKKLIPLWAEAMIKAS